MATRIDVVTGDGAIWFKSQDDFDRFKALPEIKNMPIAPVGLIAWGLSCRVAPPEKWEMLTRLADAAQGAMKHSK